MRYSQELIGTAHTAFQFIRVPNVECLVRLHPPLGWTPYYYPLGQATPLDVYDGVLGPDDPVEPVSAELLEPVAELLPALYAQAFLLAFGSKPLEEAGGWATKFGMPSKDPRDWVKKKRPKYEFLGPSGDTVSLTPEEARHQVAKWQLEILGWEWSDRAGHAQRDKAWYDGRAEKHGNRPETLRGHVIRRLAHEWHDGESVKAPRHLVHRIRLALRGFFPPEQLATQTLAQAIRDKP